MTTIARYAFSDCTNLNSINYPRSWKTAGSYIFKGCSSLTSITVPEGVTAIPDYAFSNANYLHAIELPSTLERIGTSAFHTCTSMQTIELPDGVTTICDYAFYSCTNINTIYLPKSLTIIGQNAFANCTSLTVINYAGDASEWTAVSVGSGNDSIQNKEINFDVEIPDKQYPSAIIQHGELLLDMTEALSLDASASSDNIGIMTFMWDLGDGSVVSSIKTAHYYDSPGTYIVTLTVKDYSGNTTVSTVSVLVVDVNDPDSGYTTLVFNICDSVSLDKMKGSQVSLVTDDGQRMALTDNSGKVSFVVRNGSYDVNICAKNYFVRTVTVIADGGIAEHDIGLNRTSIMTGSFTVTELTWEEIIEAGIDPEDDGNQHVYEYAAVFTFVAGVKTYDIPYYVLKNESEKVVGSSGPEKIHIDADFEQSSGQSGSSGPAFGDVGGWDIVVYPITEEFLLIIYGEAHWLKEMYRAELIVNNNSNTDELLDVTATINLPQGMSLAAMVAGQQNATKELGNIGCSSSASAEWYLRGDEEGDYNINVDVTATTSYGEELHAVYSTAEPVHVYAGSALHMHIIADDIAERGKDYTVKFRLENVSDKSIYGLSFGITGMEQYKVLGYGDKEAWMPLENVDYGDAFTKEIKELAPSGYVELELSTTIWFNSALELIAFTEVGAFVDIAYYLTDVTMVTLGGSTTEIPYDYEINRVERDHIVSKIIKELYGLLFPEANVSYDLGGTLIEITGEILGADVHVIRFAKTLLKLQKGETDSRLTISINDGRGTEDSIYNDVVRITTGTPGEGIIDTLNGTKIKCNPGEGKWVSIEAKGPGSTRIKVAIEDDYGRVRREYSFNYIVEDKEISQKLTLSPDEINSKTTVDANTWAETIRKIREDEKSAYESNPYMWFDSTLELEIEGKTTDSNYTFTLTEKQIKDLTDKTAVTNIKLEGSVAGMDFPREVLETYAAQSDEECTVYARRLGDEEAYELGFCGITYQFMMTVGSDRISSFGNQNVYITLPYELKENENADDLIIRHISEDGTVEVLNAVYDTESKTISFNTSGFSFFEITHEVVPVTGWQKIDGIWYFYDDSGSMATGWKLVTGNWYYFTQNGVMQTGWQKINNIWYYLAPSGAMQTGWQKVGNVWYYLNPSGAMQVGWLQIGGIWYYFAESGAMQTGWQKINNIWYYFNPSGSMQVGWLQIGGIWYYFAASGAMQTGWLKLGNIWYYFNPSGSMQVGWLQIGGIWYYFTASGAMQTGWLKLGNIWYYFNPSGSMQVGWLQIGVIWYYFTASGAMVTGTQIINGKMYNFSSSGAWIP